MRKLVFLTVLALCFSACTLSKNTLDKRIIDDGSSTGQIITDNKPIEGILQAQEITLNMYGTHLLEDEMGAFIVYLQSKKFALNNYIGSKVSVIGELRKTHDGIMIIDVNTIEVISVPDLDLSEKDEIYVSQNLGINFNLSSEWTYEEKDNQLDIYVKNGEILITLEKIENEKDKELGKFVDEDEQVELTINDFEAIRTTKANQIVVYIKAEQNIYKTSFFPVEETEIEKSQFYAFLKSFSLNNSKEKVKVCAGAGKIQCDSGYRCEIDSDKDLATGICVKIDAEEEIDSAMLDAIQADIRLQQEAELLANIESDSISEKEEILINEDIDPITELEIQQGYYYGQKNQKKPGTPNYWIHSGLGDAAKWHLPSVGSEQDEAVKKNYKFQVIDYINEYIDDLLKPKDLINYQIQGYEFSESQIVSVILNTETKKHKIQYRYKILDEFEVDLIEIAYFEEGDGRDWVKISGEDQQWAIEKEVVTPEGETKAVVLEDMRLYQNQHKEYSLQYPKDWYYSSFGAVNNTLWHVGFGEQAIELGTEEISVDILSNSVDNLREKIVGDEFIVSVPRDDDSHFEIYGDISLKETIQVMAGTISTN